MNECAWCGDYEYQHDETGCTVCRAEKHPWDRGPYRCDKFYTDYDEATAAFERRLAHATATRRKPGRIHRTGPLPR